MKLSLQSWGEKIFAQKKKEEKKQVSEGLESEKMLCSVKHKVKHIDNLCTSSLACLLLMRVIFHLKLKLHDGSGVCDGTSPFLAASRGELVLKVAGTKCERVPDAALLKLF